ncbi:MAG: hypothetical protein HOJ42_03505 [Gammaproteobacteria bacterium]|nr:hypothetical protein [Gammaproteobacteria bacterium]
MNKNSPYLKYFLALLLLPIISIAHDDQDDRIKFWKEYYNPKLEVHQRDIPEIKISLNKIGPFFQLQSKVKNFTLTPDQDLKNNNSWTGYGKLFINGVYVTRIYNEYLFLKDVPVGNNEFKVILSSNMDVDIAHNNKIISDTIIFQFPAYSYAEARSKAYGLSIQCEFSDKGLAARDTLSRKGMSLSESSLYLQCRHDSQKSTLDSFQGEMTRFQLLIHQLTLDSFFKRSLIWKDYEDNIISLSVAREKSNLIEKNIEIEIQKKYSGNKNE